MRTNLVSDQIILQIMPYKALQIKFKVQLKKKYTPVGSFLISAKPLILCKTQYIIKKVEYYGLRGTAKNFLPGPNSDQLPLSCGVPQGSVLLDLIAQMCWTFTSLQMIQIFFTITRT